MVYEKRTLVDGETIVNKDLLDHMQEGIAKASTPKYTKYACVGDSISYGAASTGGKTSWCDYLAERLGATLQKRASNGNYIYNHMRKQIEGINTDTELVTIMMGTNDAYAFKEGLKEGLVIGDVKEIIGMTNDYPDDYTQSSLYAEGLNILGIFRWCLERLKRKLPNARIVVITPLPSSTRDEVTLKTIIAGEAAICHFLGIEVYMPTSSAMFDFTYFNALLADKLHPNDAGYKAVAGWVYQQIMPMK